MAGEHRDAKLLYLIATSRLFESPCMSPSRVRRAAARPRSRKQVLEFFPPEAIVSFTTLLVKALLYYEGEF